MISPSPIRNRMICKRPLSKVSSCLLLCALVLDAPPGFDAFTSKSPLMVKPVRISKQAESSCARISPTRVYAAEDESTSTNVNGATSKKGDTASGTKKSSNDNQDKERPTSVLYYDKTSEFQLAKKKKKEQELENRKVAVYHNVLLKNANDCSVCTVSDKIEPSKIAASNKSQSNGVTPVQTLETQLRDIKRQVNDIIVTPSVELADAFLILTSSFLVALTTVSILPPPLPMLLYFLQDATLVLFAFGFWARWWSSLEPRGKFFNDPIEWVDLTVVVVPFLFLTVPGLADLCPSWMTSQAALINLRLLRVLRFQRILQDEFTFSKFVSGLRLPFGNNKDDSLSCVIVEVWQLQLARVLLSITTLLLVSTGLIYSAEHTVNPGIDNYFSALYCKCCSACCGLVVLIQQ